MNDLSNYDIKLLRDRLEDFQEHYDDPADIANFTIFSNAIAAIDELLARREAQGEPVAWMVGDATLYNPDTVESYVKRSGLPVIPLFAGVPQPVVPDLKKLSRVIVENLVDCGGADDAAMKRYLKWTEKTIRAAMHNHIPDAGNMVNSPVTPDGVEMKRVRLPELLEDDRLAVTQAIRDAGYEVVID